MANNQFAVTNYYQDSNDICFPDITPPTFDGITSLVAQIDGSLLASWSAGSDISTPISYAIYIQANTATGLFSSGNISALTRNLSLRVYTLADGSVLQPSITYYVGVRAIDAVGNESSNTENLNAISQGVQPTSISFVYETRGAFSINASGQLRATFTPLRNGMAGIGTLGTASYNIVDQDGNSVGISQSGITADGQGRYRITPVATALVLQDLAHYVVRVTVTHDFVARSTDMYIQLGE